VLSQIYVVIPVYNEARVIAGVVGEIRAAGYHHIIAVDDGSADNTTEVLGQLPVWVIRHRLNRGKGAAVATGLAAARALGADIVVTMDGDGQHDPTDIAALIEPLRTGQCDATLGTRLLDPVGMPRTRVIANKLGNLLTWAIHGLWVTDSQSGFRAYSRHAISVIDTRTDRYAYDSAVIRELRAHNLRYQEVPIKVRYTAYSMTKKHRQHYFNGLQTIGRMVWNLLS